MSANASNTAAATASAGSEGTQDNPQDPQHAIQRRRVRTRIHLARTTDAISDETSEISREAINDAGLARSALPLQRRLPDGLNAATGPTPFAASALPIQRALTPASIAPSLATPAPRPAIQREVDGEEELERETLDEDAALQREAAGGGAADAGDEEDEGVFREAAANVDSLRESPVEVAREMDEDQSVSREAETEDDSLRESPLEVAREMDEEDAPAGVQMKGLSISSPDDPAEEEADRVADNVMRMEDEEVSRTSEADDDSLRESPMEVAREMSGEDEIATKEPGCPHNAFRKCEQCEAEEQAQRKATLQREGDGNLRASSDVSARIQSRRGRGDAMSAGDRAFFEPRFGADFSDVRVHNDSEAHGLAADINAKAFTIGGDVFFGRGQYGHGKDSKRLFAHELTHVVQQGGARIGRQVQRKPGDLIRRREVVQREEGATIETSRISLPSLQEFAFFNLPNQTWQAIPAADELWSFFSERVLFPHRAGINQNYSEVYAAPAIESGVIPPRSSPAFAFSNRKAGRFLVAEFQGPYNDGQDYLLHFWVKKSAGFSITQQTGGAAGEGTAVQINSHSYDQLTDEIIDILDDWFTTYPQSERIYQIFSAGEPADMRTLLHRLKQRGSTYDRTPAEMVEWLFRDIHAQHREALKHLLIANDASRDLAAPLAAEFVEEEEASEIFRWMMQFHGPALNELLQLLEKKRGGDWKTTASWLFDLLDVGQEEKLRDRFLQQEGPPREYALWRTQERIQKLMAGHTGILDSASILYNFRQLGKPQLRNIVLERLEYGEDRDIDQALMRKLQRRDYKTLQGLGLALRRYNYVRDWKDVALERAEWEAIKVQVLAGGLVGIVQGGIETVADIFGGVIDTAALIYHLFVTHLYFLSYGAIGSDSAKALEDLIHGIAEFEENPKAVIEQAYLDTMQESEALEGPFEAFLRAKFWAAQVTKFALAIAGIVKAVRNARRALPDGSRRRVAPRDRVGAAIPESRLDEIADIKIPTGAGKIAFTRMGRLFICASPCREARSIIDELRADFAGRRSAAILDSLDRELSTLEARYARGVNVDLLAGSFTRRLRFTEQRLRAGTRELTPTGGERVFETLSHYRYSVRDSAKSGLHVTADLIPEGNRKVLELDIRTQGGGMRSSALSASAEVRAAIAHFETIHGRGAVKAIRTRWIGAGDNLKVFNDYLHEHNFFSPETPLALRQQLYIEAARVTWSGQMAMALGFRRLEFIDREMNLMKPKRFIYVIAEFRKE